MNNVKEARQTLRRAHLITLLIIGATTLILVVGMYWLSRSDSITPRLVNLAGEQRALTRQMSFLQYQLKIAPGNDPARLQEELHDLANRFEANHAVLTGRQTLTGRRAPLTDGIKRYYSSQLLSLDERVSRFAERALEMAALPISALPAHPTPSQSEINGLYDRLDGAVQLFERLLRKHDAQKNQWLAGGLLVLLSVHLVCWLLFLQPARKKAFAVTSALQTDLRNARQLEQQNNSSAEARARFLTTISHEFRSPISAIVGALELIPNMRDKQDELVQQAEQACYRLLTLTNNLLDIMGDEVGVADDQPISFDLVALLDECISPFSAPSRTKKLEFGMRCETALPTFVSGYPDSIARTIRNVMDNAVKFTSDGFINVLVSCHVVNKRYQLSVKIIDSGIGIKEGDQTRIFERFYRVDAPGYQQFSGAGVGLSVARKHAEQVGGRIHLASQPDIGSEFTLEFPLMRSNQKETDRHPDSSIRFAVVDDLQISRLHVSNLIRREGYSAACYSSASEFLAHTDITQFTAIIADFYMPGINGLELAATVTAMLGKRTPPIIMMSATPDIANIMANSNLGTWQAFVKPVDNRRLVDSLHQLAEQTFSTIHAVSKARILVVEDEPINAEIISHMVRCMGHESVVVHTGEEALEQLNVESFDAILLDINLPDMNGIEVAIIAREKGLKMPIIAVTANAFTEDTQEVRQAGIRYHLVKPVTYQELKNTLRLSLTYR